MKFVSLRDGTRLPALGQGTWRMGERGDHDADVASLRLGIERGLVVIDTAEMYADGEAERVVGAAIRGAARDALFVVSKVLPGNASRARMRASCEASLARLGIDRLDLYLLHWPGSVPIEETVDAFEALRAAGKIARWGVSNLDLDGLQGLPADCATNQMLYNLEHRGVEFDLLPWMQSRGMPMMAYSPVGQGGRLLANAVLRRLALARDATPAQLALAWSLDRDGVLSIPKTSSLAHLEENLAAASMTLTADERDALDRAFAPPRGPTSLEML